MPSVLSTTKVPTHQEHVPFKLLHCLFAAHCLEILDGLRWNKLGAGLRKPGLESKPELSSGSSHFPLLFKPPGIYLPLLCPQPCPPLQLSITLVCPPQPLMPCDLCVQADRTRPHSFQLDVILPSSVLACELRGGRHPVSVSAVSVLLELRNCHLIVADKQSPF